MELFYCPTLISNSTEVNLSPEESHHVKRVFRKKSGEPISLTNGSGLIATGNIRGFSAQSVTCQIQDIENIPIPPEQNIAVAISTIRPNRMDWAVEKLTELGVGVIQPILTQFTEIKTFKYNHLQKISISAIKQSKQAYLPQLRSPLPFRDWLYQLSISEVQNCFIAHLSARAESIPKLKLNADKKIILIIGPEGGFSEAEISIAEEKGIRTVKLAEQILRTETAAITAVAQLKVHLL
mgnify:CR=1 FL=1